MGKNKTMRRVSLRNILAHKLRLGLTVLAVVLGTAFIAGSFMFTNSLSSTFDSAVSNSFTGVDAAVSQKESGPLLNAEMRQKLADDPQVGGVNMQSSQTVVVANSDSEAFQTQGGTSALVPYYAPEDTVGQPAELVEGNAPQGTIEVVVNSGAAEKFGIGIGDEVVVVHPDKQDRMTISGIVEPAIEQGSGLTLSMDAEGFNEAYGDSQQLRVAAADGVSADQLVDHLNATYEVEAESGQKLADELSETISGALKFVNYFLIAFGLIALLVGTFIIANTFSMIVAQRTKEFALLRALGASRGQITGSVVMESLIVGLIGSALGVVAGIGLVAIIKAVMNGQGMPMDDSLGLSPSAILVPLVLGTIVTVVSAWMPAQRAGAVEPVEAMRTTESAAGTSLKVRTIIGGLVLVLGAALAATGALIDAETTLRAVLVGVGAFFVIVGFFLAGPALSLPIVPVLGKVFGAPFGAIGRLAATNSRRNPRRTAATAFALTLGIALVTAIGMLGATMKTSISNVLDDKISADYILAGPQSGSFPTPNDTADKAREADGVGEVLSLSMAPVVIDGQASLDYGPRFQQSMVMDTNPENLFQLDVAEGNVNFEAEPGFIATTDYAAEHGWQVGQTYPMTKAGGIGEAADAKLIGTFEPNQMIQGFAINQALVEELVPRDALTTQMVGVNAAEGTDLEELRSNLEEAVKDLVVVQVATGEEYASESAGAIDQMLSILYALLALAVVIAVLGIVNTLTLGVIERRQEIGMLRAVGTQRRQIRTMITLEAVQIAIFGAVMGILIGLGLGWSFIQVMSDQGLDEATVPWGQLAIMLVGSGVVGVIAALWPAGRAAKTPPLEAISS
ncbi:ABC transporter permease [Corynebacterium confusum]